MNEGSISDKLEYKFKAHVFLFEVQLTNKKHACIERLKQLLKDADNNDNVEMLTFFRIKI